MNELYEIIISSILDMLSKFFKNKLLEKEQKRKITSQISEWCEKQVKSFEPSALSSSDFSLFMQYQKPISKLFDCFFEKREITYDECVKRIIQEYCEDKTLLPTDASAVKSFFHGLADLIESIVREYYPQDYSNGKLDDIDNRVSEIKVISEKTHGLLTKLSDTKNECQKTHAKRKKYLVNSSFISRKVIRPEEKDKLFYSFLHADSGEDLLTVCEKDKHVVLLGEAGCGKSIELAQLAGMVFEKKSDYLPLLYKLDAYTVETVTQIVQKIYGKTDDQKLFLIFDGYDEIEEKNRNTFSRAIIDYSRIYPDNIIVISSRNNFYKYPDSDGKGSTFDEFKEYELCELTRENIAEYLVSRGINSDNFFDEIRRKKLSGMEMNPFFLVILADLFKDSESLPNRTAVMKESIEKRLKKDSSKYVNTESLDNCSEKIKDGLKKIAFAMQCMHLTKLTDSDYQRLIDEDQRNIIRYTGFFKKNETNNWQFEHNNFREYLAAEFLSELEPQKMMEIVASRKNDEIIIKESFTNTLSFYASMQETDEFLLWLQSIDASLVIKFEPSRLTCENRFNVFVSEMKRLNENMLPLWTCRFSAEELALFGMSKETCRFLLDRLTESENDIEIINVLDVIGYYSNLFGFENELKTLLLDMAQNNMYIDGIRERAIDDITKLKMWDDDVTDSLLALSESVSDSIIASIMIYLYKSVQGEKYIDFVLEKYKELSHTDMCTGTLRSSAEEIMCSVNSTETIIKILRTNAAIGVYHSRLENRITEKLVQKAVNTYRNGHSELYDVVLDIVVTAAADFDKNVVEGYSEFFDLTGTKGKAFVDIIEKSECPEILLGDTLGMLATNDGYEYLYDKIREENAEKFIHVLFRLTLLNKNDRGRFAKNKEILLSSGIIKEEDFNFIDHNNIRKNGERRVFDSLFDKDDFSSLINEFVEYTGNCELTINQLDSFNRMFKYKNESDYAFEELIRILQSCFGDDNQMKVTDVVASIDWKAFSFRQIFVLCHQYNDFSLTTEQKHLIACYCDNVIEKKKDEGFVTIQEDDSISFLWDDRIALYFSGKYDINYEKPVFKQFLSIPQVLLDEETGFYEISQYVLSHLTEEEIKDTLKSDMSTKRLSPDVRIMYLLWCKEKHYEFAVDFAISVATKAKTDYEKQIALDYLVTICELDEVYDLFLDTEDEKLFNSLVSSTIDKNSDRLRQKLDDKLENDPNDLVTVERLMRMKSIYGFESYYEIIKEQNCVANCKSYTNSFNEIIATVNNPEFLDIINKIREVRFSSGFIDCNFSSLWSCLNSAYRNIAKNNSESVVSSLKNTLNNTDIEDEKSFCSITLSDIFKDLSEIIDKAMSLKEVKNLIRELQNA